MEIGIVELAALITGSAGVIFVLGLFALVYPVYRDIAKNSPTTLYVISLMPRTVVIGHGFRLIVGIPLIWALLFATSLAVPLLIPQAWTNVNPEWAGPVLSRAIPLIVHELPVIAAVAIVLFFLGCHDILRAAGLYDILYPSHNRRSISIRIPVLTRFTGHLHIDNFSLSLVAANFIACAGGTVGGFIIVSGDEPWDKAIVALVIIFLTIVVANLLAIVAIEPLMPKVTATLEGTKSDGEATDPKEAETDSNEAKTITGYLLAHSDGYWYIFEDAALYPAVNAVPDNKAQMVVLRQVDAT